MYSLKMSKLKGGKIGLKQKLYNLKSGKGTPAIKKLDEEEIKMMDNLSLGGKGLVKKNIKPLQFKL